MNKAYVILFLTAISVNSALFSQSSDEKCFDENTHIINFGIGFGGGRYYKSAKNGNGYSYTTTPAFSFSYEQAWTPKLGPGYLGIGAYIGYQHASYRYNYVYSNHYNNGVFYNGGYYYEHNWNYFMVAAQGIYHWDKLNSEKAEVYGGVILGARLQTYSYSTNDPSPNNYRLNDNSFYPVASLLVGARWYFVPKFAAFVEAGYGISYITLGVSFKF